MLRFDGLYVSRPRDSEDSAECRTYFRFYPDGCVVEQAVQQPATVVQIMKWLTSDKVGIPIGQYRYSADTITFYTILEYGSDHPGEPPYPSVREDYEGTVHPDKLMLTCSKPSGKILTNCVFEFLSE